MFKAVDDQGRLVVLKRILLESEKEGFPITAVREIKFLQLLDHPNIVRLLDVVASRGELCSRAKQMERANQLNHVVDAHGDRRSASVFLVFEYMDHDITGLLENDEVILNPAIVKYYMQQILIALDYLHENEMIHRDIKGMKASVNCI